MSKFVRLVMLVVMVGVSLAACGTPTPAAQPPAQEQPAAAPTEAPKQEPAAPQPAAGETVIKVGINSENVPWEFMKDGKLTGFEVEMMDEIAKRGGFKWEPVTVEFSGIFTGLQAKKWDIAASSIWIKESRLKEMDFADPYYDSDMALMTRNDSTIKKFEDMKGGTFGADTGSANDEWLKNNKDKYGYEIKNYNNPTDAFLDLQAGRIDGVVADSPTALFYAQQNVEAGLTVPLLMNTPFPQAIAFRKGDPMRDAVNAIQNEMKKDGTLGAIYKKWFGQDAPAGSSTVTVYEGGYKYVPPAQ